VKKEWVAEFQGHQIRVTNSWFGGAKLYINGECRATNKNLIADPSAPSLNARVKNDDTQSPLVEVFFEAIRTVKAKIFINGTLVAGDEF
jgi:hypothetical protein